MLKKPCAPCIIDEIGATQGEIGELPTDDQVKLFDAACDRQKNTKTEELFECGGGELTQRRE
jgi:hypothetical protein